MDYFVVLMTFEMHLKWDTFLFSESPKETSSNWLRFLGFSEKLSVKLWVIVLDEWKQ